VQNIKGKVAFITGGASGIGLGIAKVFANNGMKVIIADMRQDALDEAMAYFKKTKQPVHPIKLDVTDRVTYAKAADEAEAVFKKIHVLVNNAGVGSGGSPVEELTYKDWDYSMSVNVGGVVNGIMTIVPRILKHGEGGHVVSTSSTCGLMATGGFIVYCATKFAVAGMMECLADELQNKGIGVSVLIPGPTNTNLGASSFVNKPANLRNEGETWPPPSPPPSKDGKPQEDPSKMYMDPIETGERVLRGIRNNDLFIITHPEYKAGFKARNEAIIRACPDEPRNEERWEVIKTFGTLLYNPIYDKQQQVGPPDW
jgi:NAD(P)-dependent dehydrogenase (short-subunit alcohol dehydrogenase family)